jgi:hypothetical protein
MALGGKIYIPRFIKIDIGIQNLLKPHPNTEDGNFVSLLSFSKIKWAKNYRDFFLRSSALVSFNLIQCYTRSAVDKALLSNIQFNQPITHQYI